MVLFPFKTFMSDRRRKNGYNNTADCCQSTEREFYWKRHYTAHCALHNHFKSSSGHLAAFILEKAAIIQKARAVRVAELQAGHSHTRLGAETQLQQWSTGRCSGHPLVMSQAVWVWSHLSETFLLSHEANSPLDAHLEHTQFSGQFQGIY